MKDMVQVRRGGRQEYKGPDARIGRSQFNRSHGLKTAFDASRLIPILVDEVLPGDTFTCSLNGFARIFSPLDAPILDNIELETCFFFVPCRLLWTNWVDFMGEHDAAGAQDTTYTVPILANGLTIDHDNGPDVQDLAAYFGIPDGLQTTQVEINALPFRAYNLIFNEFFRDQNLTTSVAENVGAGPDTVADYAIKRSAKKHDYFTSCLPYLQKGTAQTVSISGTPSVSIAGNTGAGVGIYSIAAAAFHKLDSDTASTVLEVDVAGTTDAGSMIVDLATEGVLDINTLRQSVAIQRLLETDARGGTRYTEIIKAHFGVTSPDFRLQRPEYLGGGKTMINISPVANTSATATQDQGELAGVGTGVIRGHAWSKSFTEHGYIIGLIRARADVTYFQGLDKLWSRSSRYDFFLPALANLGEQSVTNKEIWVSNSASTDNAVFGYQARWEEYRTKKSMITNVLNPDAASALSQWHLAEDFSSLPSLNSTFVWDQTPMSRVTTVDTQPDFLLDLWFDYKCARPLPIFGIPSLTAMRF